MTKTQASYALMVRVPQDVKDKLDAIKGRDGVPYSEQIRRAIAQWVDERTADADDKPSRRGRR